MFKLNNGTIQFLTMKHISQSHEFIAIHSVPRHWILFINTMTRINYLCAFPYGKKSSVSLKLTDVMSTVVTNTAKKCPFKFHLHIYHLLYIMVNHSSQNWQSTFLKQDVSQIITLNNYYFKMRIPTIPNSITHCLRYSQYKCIICILSSVWRHPCFT